MCVGNDKHYGEYVLYPRRRWFIAHDGEYTATGRIRVQLRQLWLQVQTKVIHFTQTVP
jgi:hypothetical protein